MESDIQEMSKSRNSLLDVVEKQKLGCLHFVQYNESGAQEEKNQRAKSKAK